MSYRREVEALLGKELMTVLVNQLKEGIMTDAQMMEFVLQLGILSKTDPNILLGNHKRRMSRDKDRRWDTEFLEVMDDWWEKVSIRCHQVKLWRPWKRLSPTPMWDAKQLFQNSQPQQHKELQPQQHQHQQNHR